MSAVAERRCSVTCARRCIERARAEAPGACARRAIDSTWQSARGAMPCGIRPAFRTTVQSPGTWHWIVFGATLGALLALDLFVHRAGRHTTRRSAIVWSVIWVSAGLAFSAFIFATMGVKAGEEYLAAYVIEKSLSTDNLFLFFIIFQSLKVPENNQHKVLSWGIFGALVFRLIFIFAGVAALERWEWVTWIFAGLLMWAAYRSLREDPTQKRQSDFVRWLSARLPITGDARPKTFFIEHDGKRVATPLLLAVVAVELSDIAFAIDSVPAALAVTRQKFVVYSSNAFAILGLRALYLVLASTLKRMTYLHYGLAFVLAFAAVKIVISKWVEISPVISVGIIVVAIGLSVWLSLRRRRRNERSGRPRGDRHPQPA